MIDFKKYVPSHCYSVIVKTEWGVRRAMPQREGHFLFTDCTHPHQNCYCAQSHIIEWEYENPAHTEQLLFTENTYQKELDRKKSEELLISLKPSYLDKISYQIKSFFFTSHSP